MSHPARSPAPLAAALSVALLAAAPGVAQQATPQVDEPPLVLEAHPAPAGYPDPADVAVALGLDYTIGRHDLLEIRVFGVEELNQVVRVGNDGSITLPLLGRLKVAGLTKTELESTLAGLLEERFVHDPQVTVFVKDYESKKIAVGGAVREPGTYEMLGSKTLLEMITMAGGVDRNLGTEIIVFRPDGDGTRRLAVDVDGLVHAADPELNLVVRPGDIIYVPVLEMVRIFVSGAVRNPDLYEVPRDEPVTVLKAITLAGGITDRAAEKRVQIIRSDPGGERVILEVNLRRIKRGKAEDPLLREDDLILVPEGFF